MILYQMISNRIANNRDLTEEAMAKPLPLNQSTGISRGIALRKSFVLFACDYYWRRSFSRMTCFHKDPRIKVCILEEITHALAWSQKTDFCKPALSTFLHAQSTQVCTFISFQLLGGRKICRCVNFYWFKAILMLLFFPFTLKGASVIIFQQYLVFSKWKRSSCKVLNVLGWGGGASAKWVTICFLLIASCS